MINSGKQIISGTADNKCKNSRSESKFLLSDLMLMCIINKDSLMWQLIIGNSLSGS